MNFHFDELVWRDDKHQHDQAMTWLSAIENDDEFDRIVMLCRYARAFSGGKKSSLKNREAVCLRIQIDKILVVGCFKIVGLYDGIVSVGKNLCRAYRKTTGRREDIPRDDYGRPIK